MLLIQCKSKRFAETQAVDRCLGTAKSETKALLSCVLYANPHESTRYSLKRGEDIPVRPIGFKHPFVSNSLSQIARGELLGFCLELKN